MPRKAKDKLVGEYYTWSILNRDGVAYADGRSSKPSLGKHSLGVRHENRHAVVQALQELDRATAIKNGIRPAEPASTGGLSIEEGWSKFLDYCSRPLAEDGVSPATMRRYRPVRDKHVKFCAAHNVATWIEITLSSLKAYTGWLHKQKYCDATIYFEGTLIKQVVKWMILEHCLPDSSRLHLRLRRSEESSTYCYRVNEVQAMIDHCSGSASLKWLAVLMVALANTGMRISEAIGLRWSDVDLSTKMILLSDNRRSGETKKGKTLKKTKNGRSRRIPIHPSLLSVLQALPRHADNRVFHGPDEKILDDRQVRLALIKHVLTPLSAQFPAPADEVGFSEGRLHSFRHFFVSQCFLGGASEGEIREWVGHTSSRIVERYRHLADDEAQRKMQRLAFVDMTPTTSPVIDDGNESPEADGAGCSGPSEVSDNPSEVPAANMNGEQTVMQGDRKAL